MNAKDNFFTKRQDTPRNDKKFIARPHKVTKNGGEFFNKTTGESEPKGKTFDKKSYRIKKYSNKYKLDKWEQNRRKDVLKKYYKDVKNDPDAGKYKPFDFDEGEFQPPNYVMHPDLLDKLKNERTEPKKSNDFRTDKMNPFAKAKLEMQRIKDERQARKEAAIKAREDKNHAIEIYKQKKAEKYKKLSKKTKSGQPLMRDRMQMLLDTIQKTI